MTELIPGKRYRVTRTGTARPSGQLIELDGGALVAPDDPGTTVELLPDPLPTTPGSVAWTEVRPFMLGLSGEWADEDGDQAELEWLNEQKIVRVFDAGAQR